MKDANRPKAMLESFAYALDLEIQVGLLGIDFDIQAISTLASSLERIVRAFALSLDPQLGTLKLKLMPAAETGAWRLRPAIGGEEFAQGATAALVATALWRSVMGLRACVEAASDALAAHAPEVADILKHELSRVERQLQPGQAVEVTCLVKESWEYRHDGRRRIRSEEWRVESGQIRRPGDEQPICAKTQPLAGSTQIPLRWPFHPLSFFGPGDPFTPWWEKREE
jgi:hypothetical protein